MTGKAKLEFEKFILERDADGAANVFVNKYETTSIPLDLLKEDFKRSLIIEWLDTVKLNVYAVPVKNGWFSCVKNGDNDLTHGLFIDRQSATEAAIKKAVEIFNEKNKEQ